jgi:HSP20 family protein
MSLVKFNNNRWPWNYGLTDYLESNDHFDTDFFNLEKAVPAMNVRENEDHIEIELASPGFEKTDFNITLNDNILEVAANREDKRDNYSRKEFNFRSFRRSMQLPKTVDRSKKVEATYTNGILQLKLSKKQMEEEGAKKKIKIS